MSDLSRRADSPDEELLSAEWPAVATELTDPQRVARIARELTRAFDALSDVRRGVTVFGSARLGEGTSEYATARELARRLASEAQAAVITGGGPGIMEAANRGASEGTARSVGLLIDLPFETGANAYVELAVPFHYFFTRKVSFVRYSDAFVAMPGGFGTMDELFEVLTLVQTHKIRRYPIVLVGAAFWGGLADWIRETLLVGGLISPGDEDLLTVTDDLDEVVDICREACDLRTGPVDGPPRLPD